jgi:SAM-dependent methyltransferase
MIRFYPFLIRLQDVLRGLSYRLFFFIAIRGRARRMASLLLSYIPSDTNLLDIGSGTGDLATQLARRRNLRCTYLDRRRLFFHPSPRPLVLCDGQALAFRQDVFDTVLLITTLHHCSHPGRILQEAKRVCRGRIIVVEDVFLSRWERVLTILKDTVLNLELFGHPRHFHSPSEWEEIFSDLGLSVEVQKPFRFRVLWIVRFRDMVYVLREKAHKKDLIDSTESIP